MSNLKKPPIGTSWRILVKNPEFDIQSSNYRILHSPEYRDAELYQRGHVFDELAICFAPDPVQHQKPFTQHNATTLHLEQMNSRDWYLGIGDLQFNIHVGKDGRLFVMLYGGEATKFTDSREAK